MKSIFELSTIKEVIGRVNQLNENSSPQWGKMSVDQMLAHCNVTYEMVYDDIHKKPSGFMKFILKLMVKNAVVSDKPYKRNGSTAPAFIVKGDKDFDLEKKRLIDYIERTGELGANHFDGKESHSFGALSINEWNNMFYKHLDHHLGQFGV